MQGARISKRYQSTVGISHTKHFIYIEDNPKEDMKGCLKEVKYEDDRSDIL